MEKNIKNIKQQFKNMWVYYTDPKLAEILKWYIDIEYNNVYDPTCWQWNILSVFDDDILKYWQEIDGDELEKCKNNLKNFVWYFWDTLKDPWFIDMKFDCIVANYPFSIKWDPFMDKRFSECWIIPTWWKADYAFLLHILYYLSNNWIAITLNFPWILYRWWKEKDIRKRIIENNYIDKIVSIPSWYFVDTNIQTSLIIFKKNRTTDWITFVDININKSKIIDRLKIIENDYNLSVWQYIREEIIKEPVDPKVLMSKARNQFVIKLRRDIEFDREICKLEWRDFNLYIDGLIKEVKKYKKF
jgi:type I restriction enzyme M protein